MFTTVMWATDGSPAADNSLPLARTLAQEGGGKLIVVHCEEVTVPGKGGGSFPVYADEEELRAKIDAQLSELSEAGLTVTMRRSKTRVGGAAHVIAEAAQEEAADLIVVGTRGHTPLGGLLLGSVTQRLLHIARCPVLAVPPARATA